MALQIAQHDKAIHLCSKGVAHLKEQHARRVDVYLVVVGSARSLLWRHVESGTDAAGHRAHVLASLPVPQAHATSRSTVRAELVGIGKVGGGGWRIGEIGDHLARQAEVADLNGVAIVGYEDVGGGEVAMNQRVAVDAAARRITEQVWLVGFEQASRPSSRR